MKNTLYGIFTLLLFISCNSEKGWDCAKTAGTVFQEELELEAFTKIEVYHRVQLFVSQGETQKVILETGENLRPKISAEVINGVLKVKNDMSCNLFREYGITKIYVTSPDIDEIRNSSGLTVKSVGILQFPKLTLLSEDTSSDEITHTNGDYELGLEVEELTIVGNGKANYFISGTATKATIGLFSGDSRFEGSDLIVEDMNIYHRSTNKMFLHPRQSLRGELRSTGDAVLVHVPPVLEVVQHFSGKLIFP